MQVQLTDKESLLLTFSSEELPEEMIPDPSWGKEEAFEFAQFILSILSQSGFVQAGENIKIRTRQGKDTVDVYVTGVKADGDVPKDTPEVYEESLVLKEDWYPALFKCKSLTDIYNILEVEKGYPTKEYKVLKMKDGYYLSFFVYVKNDMELSEFVLNTSEFDADILPASEIPFVMEHGKVLFKAKTSVELFDKVIQVFG